ncbi:MAG: YjfB family protein [Bacillota bacterium]
MDIGALSIVLSQSKHREAAGILVLKKAMTTAQENGNAIVEMISRADATNLGDPNMGNYVDEYV